MKNNRLTLTCLTILMLTGPISLVLGEFTEANTIPGKVIIKFKQPLDFEKSELSAMQTDFNSINAINAKYQASTLTQMFPIKSMSASSVNSTANLTFDMASIYSVDIATDSNLQDYLDEISKDPNVLYAEPSYRYQGSWTPNDPLSNSQDSAFKLIDAYSAWNYIRNTADTVIAVIDSGADVNHSDLRSNIWTNSNEIENNSLDDDYNGYIDDIHGWNFISHTNNVLDNNGHGTHVAGIIGAISNNNTGIAGINWHCKLMIIKGLDQDLFGSDSLLEAIIYALKKCQCPVPPHPPMSHTRNRKTMYFCFG